jgi:hypothetical protein
MAYEVFKRTRARVETPMLSITLDGRMVINSAAVRIAREARITSALLLWDATNHKVAIKGTQKGDKNSYALSIVSASHSGSLRAKSFLSYIGWKARKRETILMTWNEKERMFEATLPLEHLELERWGVRRAGS